METKDVDRNINSLLRNKDVLESLRTQQMVIDAVQRGCECMTAYYGPEAAEKWTGKMCESSKQLEDVISRHIGNVITGHLCTL